MGRVVSLSGATNANGTTYTNVPLLSPNTGKPTFAKEVTIYNTGSVALALTLDGVNLVNVPVSTFPMVLRGVVSNVQIRSATATAGGFSGFAVIAA